MSSTTETRTEWGVLYGDGEVEMTGETRASAVEFRDALRRQIRSGAYEADDYEPMEIVTRTVRTTLTGLRWRRA